MDLKSLIRNIPDFPKPGILFRDITTVLNNPEALGYVIDSLLEKLEAASLTPDYILGIESRGFIFGPVLACRLGVGFIPVRKPGKLPAAVYEAEYDLEYGNDKLQMHQDAFPAGAKILLIDDLIATGGTAQATVKLIEKAGGSLVGCAFVIELTALEGRKKLPEVPIVTLVEY